MLHGFTLALVHPHVYCTNAAHISTSLSVSLGGSTSLGSAATGPEVEDGRVEEDGVAGGGDRE